MSQEFPTDEDFRRFYNLFKKEKPYAETIHAYLSKLDATQADSEKKELTFEEGMKFLFRKKCKR